MSFRISLLFYSYLRMSILFSAGTYMFYVTVYFNSFFLCRFFSLSLLLLILLLLLYAIKIKRFSLWKKWILFFPKLSFERINRNYRHEQRRLIVFVCWEKNSTVFLCSRWILYHPSFGLNVERLKRLQLKYGNFILNSFIFWFVLVYARARRTR
jgi:hypothetical protein